jgi:nucleoside-diphosphate-sugar epimerase
MSRVLVTGAGGFIGSHLVPALRAAGHEVIAKDQRDGDVVSEVTWAAWPATDVVVHLAARLSVPDSWGGATEFLRVNLLGTVAALGYCEQHQARLVFMSSYLYGNPTALPIAETAPLVATNPYALSKLLAEQACRFYAARGVEVTILRPFNVYGPGQAEDFVIPWIIRQARAGDVIGVKDLEPKRDYVYVADVVRAIVLAAGSRAQFAVLNVGSGVSHSVAEVVAMIQNTMGTALPVVSSGARRPDEIMDTVADLGEAQRQLGWTPQWALSQGLRETCGGNRGDGVKDV